MNTEAMSKFQARSMVFIFVLAAIGLNVLSAIALKMLADQIDMPVTFLLIGIGLVILLNALRLLVWHFTNKRYPLSTVYPLTSLFYPIMLVVSYWYGEPISILQIFGTIFITTGVFWLGWKSSSNEKAA